MFRNLGVKVNLINTRDKLLEFLDDEIIDALSLSPARSGRADPPQRDSTSASSRATTASCCI